MVSTNLGISHPSLLMKYSNQGTTDSLHFLFHQLSVVKPASEDLGQSLGFALHSLLCFSGTWFLICDVQMFCKMLSRPFQVFILCLFPLIPNKLGINQGLKLPALKMDMTILCSLPQKSPNMRSVQFRVSRGKRDTYLVHTRTLSSFLIKNPNHTHFRRQFFP